MSRSVAAVLEDLLGLMPIGWAWTRRRGSVLVAVVTVLAAAIARVEALVDDLMDEIDPGRSTRLLDAFERVLGPDPCGSGDASGSIGQRRVEAARRWTWSGGASRAWFVALARQFGVEITITEFRPLVCGDELGEQALVSSPEQFVWTIGLGPTWERAPICGDQVCGDYLGEIGLSPIECLIRRHAPAHTVPVFDYSGA